MSNDLSLAQAAVAYGTRCSVKRSVSECDRHFCRCLIPLAAEPVYDPGRRWGAGVCCCWGGGQFEVCRGAILDFVIFGANRLF